MLLAVIILNPLRMSKLQGGLSEVSQILDLFRAQPTILQGLLNGLFLPNFDIKSPSPLFIPIELGALPKGLLAISHGDLLAHHLEYRATISRKAICALMYRVYQLHVPLDLPAKGIPEVVILLLLRRLLPVRPSRFIGT
jgi:hypothetical protein